MGCGEGGIDADTGGIIKTSPRRIEQLIAKKDSSIEGVVVDERSNRPSADLGGR